MLSRERINVINPWFLHGEQTEVTRKKLLETLSITRQEVTVTGTRVVTGEVARNDWILDIGELVASVQRPDMGCERMQSQECL